MKSTLITRSIANPRRTTLAHLTDAGALAPAAPAAPAERELPASTANPRRTVLIETVPQS
ncbi:hypothetical protein [Streptomyces litchfieldiae]|uniref:Uncharacterized protein n=1 Tax=Streptomyces litchfieldiae TaxID=3075543 RepID=A0ABU2MJU4_9ACTN|nr:hypothetical protein [Streptomyces sp. DSM 44938]MDT0341198.1 hypothetical protein [Streptomyces sp. DSM 44938]